MHSHPAKTTMTVYPRVTLPLCFSLSLSLLRTHLQVQPDTDPSPTPSECLWVNLCTDDVVCFRESLPRAWRFVWLRAYMSCTLSHWSSRQQREPALCESMPCEGAFILLSSSEVGSKSLCLEFLECWVIAPENWGVFSTPGTFHAFFR